MSSGVRHLRATMLIGVLAGITLIGLAHGAALLPYHSYDEQLLDSPEFDSHLAGFFLPATIPVLEREMVQASHEPGLSDVERVKRIGGSFSFTNSLDVLRDRVLLELVRRKMQQEQKQVDANRQYLNSIGKRSLPDVRKLRVKRDRYVIPRNFADKEESMTSDKIPKRTEQQAWLDVDDPILHEDQTSRAQANESRSM